MNFPHQKEYYKMKKLDIIPAIDLRNGRCVRLVQGDYDQCTIYDEEPLEIAQYFESLGIKRLHLVDLDGAAAGEIKNSDTLELICKETSLEVDFSGGVQTSQDIDKVLEAGAKYVGIGSVAQRNPEQVKQWFATYGGDQIIIGADVWNEKIAIQGWTVQTDTSLDELIGWYADELKYLICTDISKDGMLAGPSTNLYKRLICDYPQLNIIASGGVSSLSDIEELNKLGSSGVILGKAIYENKIDLIELKRWIEK